MRYTEHKMLKTKHQTRDTTTPTSASCFWPVNNMAVKCKQNVQPCSILPKCWLFHKFLKSFYQLLCWWFCCSVVCEWFHYWINVEPPLWCSCLYSEKEANNREWTLLPYTCCPQLCVCYNLALTQLNTATQLAYFHNYVFIMSTIWGDFFLTVRRSCSTEGRKFLATWAITSFCRSLLHGVGY